MTLRPGARAATRAVVTVLAIALGGCAGKHSLRVESADSDALLAPASITSVYRYSDANTMDIIVSDLPLAELIAAINGGAASGQVTHMHLFFVAEPGRTPLDPSASNSTIRHIVFAGEQVGVYGGGGLLRPSSRNGAAQITARISEASLRLLDASPGFRDPLGSAALSGSVRARRNDADAGDALAALTGLYLRTEPS